MSLSPGVHSVLVTPFGSDESLDEEVCTRCYERLLPADETMRRSGSFGPKLDFADDDPIQVKALRFFGRPA